MGSRSRSGGRAHPARDRGFEGEDTEISSFHDRSSFRFRSEAEPCETLGDHLRAHATGWGAFSLVVERVASTNELARELAKQGAPHGSLVVAETQRVGRGRWDRRWESARGGLYMSLVLRPARPGDGRRLALLPLLASIAAAEAIEAVSGLTVRLRWPNDLYRDARKLGGVLVESSFSGASPDYAIVGIGINVNQAEEDFPAEMASSSTSLRRLVARSFDRLEVAAQVVAGLERWWQDRGFDAVLERFRQLAEGLEGHPIEVRASDQTSFSGTSLGISTDGGLRVELSDGTERVLYSDDVVLLRPQDAPEAVEAPVDNYYAAVERHFVQRRGSPLFITPGEWQLVWEWEREGIPLSVVLEGIDRVFERPKTQRRPRKLGYCRQTVEAAYRRYREVELGGGEAPMREEPHDAQTHLAALAKQLRRAHAAWEGRDAAVAESLASCQRGVEALVHRVTPESLVEIEDALSAEEERLLDALESSFPDDRRGALLRESEASLAAYRDRMPERVHAAAVRSAYRRRLRNELGVPTLSLLDR